MRSATILKIHKLTRPHLFLIQHCSSMKQVMEFHAHFITSGRSKDPIFLSSIISFTALSPAGDLDYAHSVFSLVNAPNAFMFNTMIRGYASISDPGRAIVLYNGMLRYGIAPNNYTFPFVIKALSKGKFCLHGEAMHCSVIKYGHVLDLHVANSLLNMYASFGLSNEVSKVFDEIPEPDVVSWNVIIDDLSQKGCLDNALCAFTEMSQQEVEPNSVTFLALVSACTKTSDFYTGKLIHLHIIKSGISISENLGNGLLDMYCKYGDLESAEKMFSRMQVKTVFSWTSLLDGYIQKGELERAMVIFHQMPIKDTTAWNVMLSGFVEAGDVNSAEKIFREMPERDLVSWNSMIIGYAQNNKHIQSLQLLKEMLNLGMELDRITLAGVFSVCGYTGSLFLGESIHSYMEKQNIKGEEVEAALMDMYSKCGASGEALKVFEMIATKSVLGWTVMIVGLAMNGLTNEALSYLHQMCQAGVKPNEITFLGALCACSHAGLVEEGKRLFSAMIQVYGITPRSEHYSCMVDLLGRAGLLEEAEKFIQDLPAETDAAGTWGALLGACRMHGGEVQMAEKITRILIEIDPFHSGRYVLLSNIYAAENRWHDAENVRKKMKASGVQKMPAFSFIELN